MSQFYEELCNMFIRPTRQKYNMYDLGISIITTGNPIVRNVGRRRDFEVISHHNLKLKCSYFQNLVHKTDSCLIYLHSFNGSRLESLRYCAMLLERGYNVCNFDFAGSGNSQGQFVSLGFHQRLDLMEVIKYIGRTFQIWNFLLWGRSMGAATIIKFCEYLQQCKRVDKVTKEVARIRIQCIVLDSPFCSLSRLAIEIAQKRIAIPQIFIKAVFLVIKNTIEKKAEFKVNELELLNCLPSMNSPVFIVASHQDSLVQAKHSEDIYKGLNVRDKQMIFVKGEHHQVRDNQTLQRILYFLERSKHCNQQMRGSLLRQTKIRNGNHPPERKNQVKSHSKPKIGQSSLLRQNVVLVQHYATNTSGVCKSILIHQNSGLYTIKRDCFQGLQSKNLAQSTLHHTKGPFGLDSKDKIASYQRLSPRAQKINTVSEKRIRIQDNIILENRIQDYHNHTQERIPFVETLKKVEPHSSNHLAQSGRIQTTTLPKQTGEQTRKKHNNQSQHRSIPSRLESFETRTVRINVLQYKEEDHYNIINSKLKKRKKQSVPQHFYTISPNQTLLFQTNLISMIGNQYNNQGNMHDQNNQCQMVQKTIQSTEETDKQQLEIKQIFITPSNDGRYKQVPKQNLEKNFNPTERRFEKLGEHNHSTRKVPYRLHTLQPLDQDDYGDNLRSLIKNKTGVISLKNLTNQILAEASPSKAVGHMSSSQAKRNQKFIHLKSPNKNIRYYTSHNTTT